MILSVHNYKNEHIECIYTCATTHGVLTLSFSNNPNNPGEILRKRYAKKHLAFPANLVLSNELLNTLIKGFETSWTGLYISGDNAAMGLDQVKIDKFISDLIAKILEKTEIYQIVSTGQSGFEEAAIKAGIAHDVFTHICTTRDWNFRDKEGNFITNKDLFMARFPLELVRLIHS